MSSAAVHAGGWRPGAALRGGPLWWVALHRHHHRCARHRLPDIHPAPGGFGWGLRRPGCRGDSSPPITGAGQRPWRRPELCWLNRHWLIPSAILAASCFLIGGWGTLADRFRTVFAGPPARPVPGVGCSGSSVGQAAATPPRPKPETARRWLLLAPWATAGTNNHHHCPGSARQGFYWWETDTTWGVLWLALSESGLVWNSAYAFSGNPDPQPGGGSGCEKRWRKQGGRARSYLPPGSRIPRASVPARSPWDRYSGRHRIPSTALRRSYRYPLPGGTHNGSLPNGSDKRNGNPRPALRIRASEQMWRQTSRSACPLAALPVCLTSWQTGRSASTFFLNLSVQPAKPMSRRQLEERACPLARCDSAQQSDLLARGGSRLRAGQAPSEPPSRRHDHGHGRQDGRLAHGVLGCRSRGGVTHHLHLSGRPGWAGQQFLQHAVLSREPIRRAQENDKR